MTLARNKATAALGLRLAGASFEEIADTLNMPDHAYARRAVEQALAEEVTTEDRRHHRTLANLRYERLLRAVWGKAINPESPEQLPAARSAREIIDRMVTLNGAAQPAEVIVHNPGDKELIAWLEKVKPIELPAADQEVDPFAPGGVVDAEVVDE